jgi:hypothetical protein
VPSTVAKLTPATSSVGPVLVTVKVKLVVPALPSFMLTSLIVSVGAASSFVIVPTPVPSAIVAPLGAERLTVKFSFASWVSSPVTSTVIVFDASAAVKLTVPLAAV